MGDKCFKASETLLGIETGSFVPSWLRGITLQSLWNPFRDWNFRNGGNGWGASELQSLWNPFRDWNLFLVDNITLIDQSFKASETLLGIETRAIILNHCGRDCFKASETLLGIETCPFSLWRYSLELQSLWNPFRDWNFVSDEAVKTLIGELQSLWNPFRDWNQILHQPAT